MMLLTGAAVVLLLTGAVFLVTGVVTSGIAFPLIGVGAALVAIELTAKRRSAMND